MADDTLILSFDTSTSCCSLALTAGGFCSGRVIASLALVGSVTHSRRLLGSVDWLLKESALRLADLSAVAVGLGPGSFTGLRIGLATAKGIAQGANKPLIGISTLDILAASVRSDQLICAVLDARKKEVYSCFYRCDKDHVARRCGEPAVHSPRQLVDSIAEPVVMIGDGAFSCRKLLTGSEKELIDFVPAQQNIPAAAVLGFLADERYGRNLFLKASDGVPIYVRASDAELSLVKPRR